MDAPSPGKEKHPVRGGEEGGGGGGGGREGGEGGALGTCLDIEAGANFI